MQFKYLSFALILASCTNQIFGQSLCSSNSDCSSISGQSCMIPGGCKKGYCSCPAGQYSQNNKCVNAPTPPNKVQLGGTCQSDGDCGVGASCQSSKCACLSVLTPASDNVNCQSFGNGQTCNTNQYCGSAMVYGSCSGGKCQCNSGYMWALGGDIGTPGTCVPNAAQVNLGQGSACTATSSLMTDSAPKLCGTNLHCLTCPEGGSPMCMSGSAVTVSAALLSTLVAVLLTLALLN